MEDLLRRTIKQSVPTHAVKFIIVNIICFFLVIIGTFLLVTREYNINNVIRADFFATGLMMALENIVLIVTGIVSIRDYKKTILGCLEDIKEADKYCNDIIQQATDIEEDDDLEDDPCMNCLELCDNCEIFKERIKNE